MERLNLDSISSYSYLAQHVSIVELEEGGTRREGRRERPSVCGGDGDSKREVAVSLVLSSPRMLKEETASRKIRKACTHGVSELLVR